MTKQCLLSFHISNFSDQVLCDVVEIDACHVLLGRPWLFDRKVLPDGRENTYEFNKDGQRYRLEPVAKEKTTTIDNSDVGCSGSRSGHVMLCSAKEFMKEQKKAKFCLAIMPKKVQEDEEKSYMPMEIQQLLDEFAKIVADDMPMRMPIMRSISHQNPD